MGPFFLYCCTNYIQILSDELGFGYYLLSEGIAAEGNKGLVTLPRRKEELIFSTSISSLTMCRLVLGISLKDRE